MKPTQATSIAAPSRGPLLQPPVRLGLSRAEAAEYIGVGIGLFDQMVADGRMPPPRQINARLVWSRPELEKWFSELPYAGVQGQIVKSAAAWDTA